MRKRRILGLALAGALMASACSGDDTTSDDGGDATEESGGTWTVLQYQMADTDLEPFMMDDVNEMGEVGSGENLDIVALIDRSADYGENPALDLGDWVGAKLVHIGQGTGEVLDDVGDINLGDPATLTEFIAEGIKAYPADHYALIVSDHGAAWPGVGPDEASGSDVLDLEEIRTGIADGLEGAGIDQLDLIGFDACLMASYEVASTLAPLGKRMIASAELEPGHGWDYRALEVLADGTGDVDTFGQAILDGFQAQAAEQETGANITLALLDLEQIGALDEAVGELSSALAERGASVSPAVGRTLAQNLGYGRSPDPTEDTHMTDLGTLVGTIGVEALDVSDQADAVLRALGDAVLARVAGPQAEDFSGLSIYFPPSEDLFNPEYQSVEVAAPWLEFLGAYYGAGAAIPAEARPAFLEGEPAISFDADGLTALATLDPEVAANAVEARISYGVLEADGSTTYLGDEQATIGEDGTVEGFYDLTSLTLSDGQDSATGYVSLGYEEDQDGYTIDVPMGYFAPEDLEGETYQDALLSVVVDGEGNVVQETYYAYDDEAGTYGELTTEPAGIIVPEVLIVDGAGEQSWVATSDVGLFADLPNIQYAFDRLPSGTQLVVELSVTDYGGETATISTVVVVP